MKDDLRFSPERSVHASDKWTGLLLALMAVPGDDRSEVDPKELRQICGLVSSYIFARLRSLSYKSSEGGLADVESPAPRIPHRILQGMMRVRAFRLLKDMIYEEYDTGPGLTHDEWKLIEEGLASLEAEYLTRLDAAEKSEGAGRSPDRPRQQVRIVAES